MFIFIAFIGGMISLLSPCTLSVIPLLFAGFQGRFRHIIALLAGMVVMFTTVALLVTATAEWVVDATRAGRWLAMSVLVLSALALISPAFAQRIAGPAVRLGNHLNARSINSVGVVSAFLAGLAVGLLWSPCAGPILGAIFSIGISGGSSVTSGVLLAAYGSGCATMLALLVWGGRRLLAPLKANTGVMARFRVGGGIAMLVAVILNVSGIDYLLQGSSDIENRLEQRVLQWMPHSPTPAKLQPVQTPLTLTPSVAAGNALAFQPVVQTTTSAMPSFDGGTGWINGDPVTPASLSGKVVLVDFWTWGCINCKHTLPYVREWANKYGSQGLVVIGVHTPEFPWEKPLFSVKNAIDKWKLPYRVVTDNNYQIWNRFGNNYWPAQYYFDAKGQLRYSSYGEGEYDKQEKIIQQLLKEAKT